MILLEEVSLQINLEMSLPGLLVHVCLVSRVWLFATPWTRACQAPLSMQFSRQEYWSGFPFPSPGSLFHPGIKPRSPALQADSLPSEPPGKPQITPRFHFPQPLAITALLCVSEFNYSNSPTYEWVPFQKCIPKFNKVSLYPTNTNQLYSIIIGL